MCFIMTYIYKIVFLEARIAHKIFISFMLSKRIKKQLYEHTPLKMPSYIIWIFFFFILLLLLTFSQRWYLCLMISNLIWPTETIFYLFFKNNTNIFFFWRESLFLIEPVPLFFSLARWQFYSQYFYYSSKYIFI